MNNIVYFSTVTFKQVKDAIDNNRKFNLVKNRKSPFIKNKYRDENNKNDGPFLDGIKEATGRDLHSCYSNYRVLWKDEKDVPIGGRCLNCCCDFSTTIVGRPTRKEVRCELDENGNEKLFIIFFTEEAYCSRQCCLRYILDRIRGCVTELEEDMVASCKMLKEWHYLETGEELKPSQDPRLLEINKGSLTRQEWEVLSGIYQRTSKKQIFTNITYRPCRTIYSK